MRFGSPIYAIISTWIDSEIDFDFATTDAITKYQCHSPKPEMLCATDEQEKKVKLT